ncbi:MAG: ChbG/HpnK family deacetylase [Candidatus Binatia bacterium]
MESIKYPLRVNAADFGLSEGINRAIIAAHIQGVVSSVGLMVVPLSYRCSGWSETMS